MKFVKKPVVIEALQWDGTRVSADNISKAFPELITVRFIYDEDYTPFTTPYSWVIYTLEGTITAKPNDWIIKGIKGEFYPCKPDVFEISYDLVDAPESFLDRVIKEKAELAERTSKLKDFIDNNPKFDELTNINRILLINQFNAMELYLYALDSRIEFIND